MYTRQNFGLFHHDGISNKPAGYSLTPCGEEIRHIGLFLSRRVIIYDFHLDDKNPLEYVTADGLTEYFPKGTLLQPNKNSKTDMGSIPLLFQPWFPKDEQPGYYFHDSGYADGGIWAKKPDELVFTFTKLNRFACDRMLYCMAMSNNTSAARSAVIFQAVHFCGGSIWKKHNHGY